jgi:prophage regulatory protein
MPASLSFLRRREVQSRTGLSRSAIYKSISDGTLTRPVHLGARAVAWPAHEVDAILAARVAGESTDAIKALVKHLHQQRQAGAFNAGAAA